jgi:hypothetical protein
MNNSISIASISDQIQCVEREIAKREVVYPKWVAAHKMTSTRAAYEIAAMRGVRETLLRVKEQEAAKEG